MTDDSNNNINVLQEVSVIDRQVSTLCKPFLNNSSDNTNFSKTELSKIVQPGGFLGRLLGPLLVCN